MSGKQKSRGSERIQIPLPLIGTAASPLLDKESQINDPSALEIVAAYHERTKHHYRRFAASPGYMDWATQPNPFRRYQGASLVRLPLTETGRALPYWQLYVTDSIEPTPLSINAISQFFRYALSLTAWKRFRDSTWSLRVNPSSGNLHPTEGYALLPAIAGLYDRPGVYHYAPKEHGLERRADVDPECWTALMAPIPEDSFLVGLSSIHWREAWKYGERAFRYCQQDVGHALGTVRFAAAALGWKLYVLDSVGDADVSRLLGLNRAADYADAEREHPDLLALIVPADWAPAQDLRFSEEIISQVATSQWFGSANVLSPKHSADWPVIDLVARATLREAMSIDDDFSGLPSENELFAAPIRSGSCTAEKVILGRRSAVSMDGATAITAETFFRMLARLVPTRNRRAIPWDAIPWRPRIHLGLFVHRVNDLPSGLYALVRDPAKVDALQQAMIPEFLWRRPVACPRGLLLYLLKEGDCRALATSVSCGQEIAGDGAFSLGMIADCTSDRSRSLRRQQSSIGICSGRRGLSARCCTLRPKKQAFVQPAWAATSTIPSTRCSAFLRGIGKASTTSR